MMKILEVEHAFQDMRRLSKLTDENYLRLIKNNY